MKISYSARSQYSEPPARRRGRKSSNVNVIAIVVVTLLLFGGVVYWFIAAQKPETETVPTPAPVTAPVPLPQELIERPFNAADGLKQCEKLTPSLATQEEKDKRAKCYAAVMTVFGTTDICTAIQLDSTNASLCAAAQASYEQKRSATPTGSSPQASTGTNSQPAIKTVSMGTGANSPTTGSTAGTSGTSQPGTQPGTSPQQGTQPGTTPTATSTTSAPPGTTPPGTQTQTGSDPGTTPGGTTSNPPSGGGTTTALELCILDPGQLVLLQHTNECQ